MRPPAKWPKLIEFLTRVRELRDRLDPGLKLVTRTVVACAQDTVRRSGVLEPLGWTPEFRPWFNLVGGAENLSGRAFEPGQGVCMFMASAQLYVAADGTVVPCCAHPLAGKLGNLAETPFSEIYAGERRAGFVDALERNRDQLAICRSCEFGANTDLARYTTIADTPAVPLSAGASIEAEQTAL
jgi:radical SAM protein with 4Fe4S-binding SPASM domain